MTKVNWIKGNMDEAEMLERLLPEVASKDQAVACAARLLRETMPAFGRWLKTEMERGTDPAMIASAVADLAVSSIISTAASLGGGVGPRAQLLALLIGTEKFGNGFAKGLAELGKTS
jgi:hypothetical protein